jgi:DegV family protein with EDD domain
VLFGIVTDTATDVDRQFLIDNNIVSVSTHVIFGDEDLRDDEIGRETFLQRLKDGEIATTSQPAPQDFIDTYQRKLTDHQDIPILGIHISSKLSGTFSVGLTSIRELEEHERIHLFDTENVSFGAGYFVYLAVFCRDKGFDVDKTIQILEMAKSKVQVEVLVKDIEYLKRSGRINIGVFSILKLFNLKPLIKVVDGKLERSGVSFGVKNGIKKMVIKINHSTLAKKKIILAYTDDKNDVAKFQNRLKKQYLKENWIVGVCNTLLAHVGPGTIGIGYGPEFEDIIKQ